MSAPVILVVDDEPANLAQLRSILGQDYQMVYARDGAEAMAAVLKHRPALVLLDVGLPDICGYVLCTELRRIDPGQALQVIFITANSGAEQEAAGFAAGGVDYIVKPVHAPLVRARVAAHLSLVRATMLERSYRDAIQMLGHAGHFNDNDTGAHIWRMAAYAVALAHAAGWNAQRCAQLELAAPMHDTGKLGVPQAILQKPGPLNAGEWAIMRTHPRLGHDILSKSDAPVFRLAAEIALYHHERWDGGGYPYGLAGTDIPESARIVALADVFDALSMRRPYKEAWPVSDIVSHLRAGAGLQFDPRLTTLFIDLMPQLLQIQQRYADPA
ncbi:HD domain-containing phosphohydrolase [Janthinobacterium psychrotolerans]|uniref:Putative two-component system response regulator n=1 Tax=Janthinobacterium psychrotolerans TaxID=1747903 RepID=A0A1A7BWD1_9BURK|nr:HD domain-containing phosphohydrolase [Janthinobacterium psychrotolerans]OBV37817.1 putative two-component system response regulator [Janthinobacterium psychrotolerans]